MAKIKLNNLPEGFEIKNGKVVKKMQQGGMTMGDQRNYGLVTNPFLDGSDDPKPNDVRYSLSSVPREIANIEAEGGETALTDLQNSGIMGLYDIKGPRHSKGGVPLYLQEGSFIYSDTDAMKLDKKELAEFGIESKKKMTPAAVSKKYKLNKFIALSENPDSDNIQKKSAELMLNKNQMGLSKLAFTQEVKKQFQDGVPKTAYPYLMSQGIDPEEFSQKVNMANENMQAMQTMARNGYELPKAQFGLSKDVIDIATGIADWFYNFIEPEAPKLPPPPVDSKKIEQKYIDQPDYYVDQLRERKRVNDSIRNSQIKQYGDEINEDDFLPLAQVGKETSNPMDEYANLEKIFTSTDPQWQKTLDRTYAAFVANAKAQGIPASKIPSREDMVKQALDYQKNNYLVKSLDPTGRFNKAFDKGVGSRKNKNTQAYFDKLAKQYPDQYPGYKIDEDQTKLNQLFFQAVALADKDNAEPFLDVISEGPDEGAKNWTFDPTISKAEGYLGNNTLNQFLKARQPEIPKQEPEQEPELEPEIKSPDPQFNIPSDNLRPAMWLQDKIKLGALAARKRNLGMPSNMYVKDPDIEWALLDPTRLIAANNETYNTTLQGIGAFGNPQAFNARASQAQGQTFANNANAIAQIQGSNINTVNQGLRFKAQMDAQTDAFRRQAKNDEYDKTTLAIENYINEKNFDREQAADLYANAITNKWNTDTLNKLYPYYNVDPASGGQTTFTGGAKFNPNRQSANQPDAFTQMKQDALSLKGSGLPDNTVNKILDIKYGSNTKNNQGFGADAYADMMRQMRSQGAPFGYTGKKGKEIKKYATPFYTGKTGY